MWPPEEDIEGCMPSPPLMLYHMILVAQGWCCYSEDVQEKIAFPLWFRKAQGKEFRHFFLIPPASSHWQVNVLAIYPPDMLPRTCSKRQIDSNQRWSPSKYEPNPSCSLLFVCAPSTLPRASKYFQMFYFSFTSFNRLFFTKAGELGLFLAPGRSSSVLWCNPVVFRPGSSSLRTNSSIHWFRRSLSWLIFVRFAEQKASIKQIDISCWQHEINFCIR